MKNSLLFFLFIVMLFSCQHRTEIKRKRSAVTKDTISNQEIKVDTITEKDLDTTETKKNKSEKIESDEGHVVLLPNNRYAVITFRGYEYKEKEDTTTMWRYVPKKVKVFNRKTKKQVPETNLDSYYFSDDGELVYGDFNFDNKMDVAIQGESLLSHTIYNHWIFYLSTQKGYKFSKSFSEIMDYPVTIFDLDAKSKTIIARDGPLPHVERLYKIKNNQVKLIRMASDDYDSPFKWIEYFNGNNRVYKTGKSIKDYLKQEDYTYFVISFEIKNSKKNITIFIDYDTDTLFYTLLEGKDSLISFDYSERFNYNVKENLLVFKDENVEYKIYEAKDEIGVEVTKNKKVSKLIGDIKSKKGSLSKLITMKKDRNSPVKNVVFE